MMRVAITGATGLLGSRVKQLLESSFDVVPLGRPNGFDLSKPDASGWASRLPTVDALLHMGAKTAVDAIEKERPLGAASEAMVVNHDATAALCGIAQARNIPFILVSTDFVFPHSMRGLYPESAAPTGDASQTSWYGWTKLLAERTTLDQPGNAVLRISYPFGPHDPGRTDHARRLLELHRQQQLYPLFDDQVFTPSYIDDVAASLAVILRENLQGIQHCASNAPTTPFEFGQQIVAATASQGPPLVRGRFQASVQPGRAPRPQHGGLETTLSRKNGLVCRDVGAMVTDFAQESARPHHTSSARSSY